jgi:prepilin-type N-terminal cleavage/methylation domain-containing protein
MACGAGDGGFSLIELLVIMVVIGILAATVIFALSGVTTRSAQSACDSDARTVAIAVGAYETQHPGTTQVTEGQVTASGTGSLQSWPMSPQGAYSITIAGDGNALVGQLDAVGHVIADNDVIVRVGINNYDATVGLPSACSSI